MTKDTVRKEALSLSPEERAQLIDSLFESLDTADQDRVDAAWAAESEGRIEAFERGEMGAVEGSSTIADLRKSLDQ